MDIDASKEVRVKDEPIYDSQSISDPRETTLSSNKPKKITNNEQSIKQERQFIPISDSKMTREDISSDEQPNKRKRQSMKVKAEKEEKFSTTGEFANKISIDFLNEETTNSSNDVNLTINTNQPATNNDDISIPRNKKSK